MRVKHDWLQIGMTKSVRAELEMKWVVGKNVSHQQYNSDKDGTGYSNTGGSRENRHWLGRSSIGVEMDRVTNHRSMWGMVRASRLGNISERDWWGGSSVFWTSPHRLLTNSTMASSSSIAPRSRTQRARRTGHVQNREVTPFPQYFNANEHVVCLVVSDEVLMTNTVLVRSWQSRSLSLRD